MKKFLFILFFIVAIPTPSYCQCWESFSVGYNNVLAIASNGTLWGWGKNTNGELGDGTILLKNSPVQIGTANNWKEVACSMDGIYSFTLAVKTDGTLWAWGSNTYGQLGDGTQINKNYPIQVGTDTDWETVAAGLSHSLAIKQNGTLWGWGSATRKGLTAAYVGSVLQPVQLGTSTDWRQVSAHDRVSVAVKTNNTVWGWGYNQNDMLNAPAGATIGNEVDYPTQKIFGSNIKFTRTGNKRSMDVKLTNSIVNAGDPTDNNPYFVKDTDNGNATTVYIRFDNNTLWYSGVMLGSTSNAIQGLTQLSTATNWEKVSVGSQIAAALNSNGEIWTWGSNISGGLGIGSNGANSSTVPVLVPCPTVLSTPNITAELSLQLYPNPAQDVLHLVSNASIDRLVIVDTLGKELINQPYEDLTIDLDISQFSKGVYIIQAFSGDSTSQIKFVKN